MTSSSWRQAAALIGLMAVLVTYWSLQYRHRRLSSQLEAELARIERPILMVGAPLRLIAGYVESEASLAAQAPPAKHSYSLVLVFSATCPACHAQLPDWIEVVSKLPLREDDEVVVIALPDAPDPVADLRPLLVAVQSRALRYRVLEVTDRRLFVATSGLTSTPTLMLVGPTGRVALYGHEFSKEFLGAAHDLLAHRTPPG